MAHSDHRMFLFLTTITTILVSTSQYSQYSQVRSHPNLHPRYHQIFYPRQPSVNPNPQLWRFYASGEQEEEEDSQEARPQFYFVKDDSSQESQESSVEAVKSSERVDSEEHLTPDPHIYGVGSPPIIVARDESAGSSEESSESVILRANSSGVRLELPPDFHEKLKQLELEQTWRAPESLEDAGVGGEPNEEIMLPPRRLFRYRPPSWIDGPIQGDPGTFSRAGEHFTNEDRMKFLLPGPYPDTGDAIPSKKRRRKKPSWDAGERTYDDYVKQMEDRARGNPWGDHDPYDLDSHFDKTRYDEHGDGHDGDGWGLTDDEILHSKGYKKYRKRLYKSAKFGKKSIAILRWFQRWMEKSVAKDDVIAPH